MEEPHSLFHPPSVMIVQFVLLLLSLYIDDLRHHLIGSCDGPGVCLKGPLRSHHLYELLSEVYVGLLQLIGLHLTCPPDTSHGNYRLPRSECL